MKQSVKTRMAQSISKSNREVFLRKDLSKFGSESRVTRAIAGLVNEGKIVKLGYGVYAKAMPSGLSGKPIPRKVLEVLAEETFKSLGVPITMGTARARYAAGTTTQVPMAVVISTGSKRVSRKISLGNREIIYEKNLARAG